MKGFWHTFEAILASVIVILFLVALGTKYVTIPTGPGEVILKGYEILKDLDKQGKLRSYVVNNDTTGLNSEISLVGYSHSVQICNSQCFGSMPNASNVWVATYVVAGENQYQARKVILYIY